MTQRYSFTTATHTNTQTSTSDSSFNLVNHFKKRLEETEIKFNQIAATFDEKIYQLKLEEPISPLSDTEDEIETKTENVALVNFNSPAEALKQIIQNSKQTLRPLYDELITFSEKPAEELQTCLCIEACHNVLNVLGALRSMVNKTMIVLSIDNFSEQLIQSITEKWMSNYHAQNHPIDRLLFDSVQTSMDNIFKITHHALRTFQKTDVKVSQFLQMISPAESAVSSLSLSLSQNSLDAVANPFYPALPTLNSTGQLLMHRLSLPGQLSRGGQTTTPVPSNAYDPHQLPTPSPDSLITSEDNSASSTARGEISRGTSEVITYSSPATLSAPSR